MKNIDAASAVMTLQDASYLAEIATGVAAIVTSVVAVWALLFAKQQLKQAENASVQSAINTAIEAATAIYRSLLERALEYPDFVAPDSSLIDTEHETFNGSQKEFRRYEAFVDLMLTTFEAMIQLPIDKIMESYIVQWLSEHRTYLLSDYFSRLFRKMVSDQLWLLVEKGTQIEANIESHDGERSLTGVRR
jgi:hypothetical protein